MKQHAVTCVAVLSLALPYVALADEPSFADLLVHAHQQVAAGHHIAPPGDNATETFELMLNRLHSATPEQVNEFLAMLHEEQTHALADLNQAVGEATPATQGTPEGPLATGGHPSTSAVSTKGAPAAALQTPEQPSTPATSTKGAPAVALQTPEQPSTPATSTKGAPAVALQTPEQPSSPAASTKGAPAVALATREQPSTPAASVASSTVPLKEPAKTIERGTLAQNAPAQPIPKPSAMAKVFFAKGKAAEDQGDFSGARRYYQMAAEGNHAEAAFALARLYEPSYVRSKALGGIDPDPEKAKYWYDRATQLNASAPPIKDAIAGR